MHINDIFYSLQGEGKLTGLPTIFIRTTGCNLRCSYCDTTEAYTSGRTYTISEILSTLQRYDCLTVCITGGEPLLQQETITLIDQLIKKKYHISIETNGSCSIQPLLQKEPVLISLDIKCPSSTMHHQMNMENINLLRSNDQLKFIIGTKEDFLYATDILNEYHIKATIFFQPVWKSSSTQLAEWILEASLPIRLGIQLHKMLWGDKKSR